MRNWPLIVLVGMSLFGCSGKRPDFDLTGNRAGVPQILRTSRGGNAG